MSIEENIAMAVISLANKMLDQQACLATAESCTGGMIAQVVTDLPGSSKWFDRGWVTYSNEAKQDLLGVSSEVFVAEGAVSQACVEQMVRGALANSKAHYAIACSGIAGPGGGSIDKPVGTVWLAWAQRVESELICSSRMYHFEGSRQLIRQQTTLVGLEGLLQLFNYK
ncbi:CinA family protein [Thiomicrospira sp. ALE5]|uniref:CinA family protein n=1 Tax=Thiomicrospira sp. ALE5 TaxID=748650 RepID=UPI0008E6B417|nr:CinA family protein [Thiomicrospira sp. ALE5]SFR59584.1 nicotinamide-nucleotide amidase [Thiomicrospira sp. ALE5]